jgi:AcrR family transcriptional regulator
MTRAPTTRGVKRAAAPKQAAQPSATVRRRFPRDERRAETLRVATRVFYAKGYDAASLQDIADELGIQKASLYYYFASKEQLLHAVLASIISRGMANVRAILAQGGDPLTKLWRLVASHLVQLCGNLVDTTVFLHERKKISLERRRDILSDDYAYQMTFIDTIKEGQALGQIRADVDAKLAALSVLGSANWTYTWYRPGGDLAPDIIGAQFANMTINSLASAEALRTWRRPDAGRAPARAGRVSASTGRR